MKPICIDLFCGAGGMAAGLRRAGFYVIGVDHTDQPSYAGDEFWCADALEWMRSDGAYLADAVHASPPCQAASRLWGMNPERSWPELIPPTRQLLADIALPYSIENVDTAQVARAPQLDGTWGVVLCGTHFGLMSEAGHLKRHRYFETNFPVPQPTCNHRGPALGVYGRGGTGAVDRHRMLYREEAAQLMGVDWPMTHYQLTQAIPPAYGEHIGRAMMEAHLVRVSRDNDEGVTDGVCNYG